jgi:hypothetical protein
MEHPGRRGLRALNQECMQKNTLAALVRGVMLSQDWENRPHRRHALGRRRSW